MLIAMAGLPASGKSTVAAGLARALSVPVVSVDPIEAAMWRSGIPRSQPTGLAAYVVAEAVADGVLALGQSVIVDAVNAVSPAREQWIGLAERHGVPAAFVEVACSDEALHRARLAARERGIPGFAEPTWEYVESVRAEFEPWGESGGRVLRLDSTEDAARNTAAAIAFVSGFSRGGRRRPAAVVG